MSFGTKKCRCAGLLAISAFWTQSLNLSFLSLFCLKKKKIPFALGCSVSSHCELNFWNICFLVSFGTEKNECTELFQCILNPIFVTLGFFFSLFFWTRFVLEGKDHKLGDEHDKCQKPNSLRQPAGTPKGGMVMRCSWELESWSESLFGPGDLGGSTCWWIWL